MTCFRRKLGKSFLYIQFLKSLELKICTMPRCYTLAEHVLNPIVSMSIICSFYKLDFWSTLDKSPLLECFTKMFPHFDLLFNLFNGIFEEKTFLTLINSKLRLKNVSLSLKTTTEKKLCLFCVHEDSLQCCL